MSVSLANGGDQTKRRALDFYPTPPEATQVLVDFLGLRGLSIWEPACGDGAMVKVLVDNDNRVIGSDIHSGDDFLLQKREGFDAIITNPPFNLSEQFIRHAIPQALMVAMLVKSQYWHAAKRAALFQQAPPAWVLPLTWRPDFMGGERGGAPTMEVLWTVWIKGSPDTRYRLLNKPKESK